MKCLVPVLMLCAVLGLVACGDSGKEAAQLKQAERQALEAERELEEVRRDRVQEEREADALARQEAQAQKIKQERRASQQAAQEEAVAEEAESSEPPKVVGLPLPAARQALEGAGYEIAPENTDTTFGIVLEENFTVCTQDPPRGSTVVVLAQKYGC